MGTFDNNKIEHYKNLQLLAKQIVEGYIVGLHKSPFHGFSVEFSEHRLYNAGESTKNIDWKLYGRTDKLFVKRFEEETNLRCQLVIDTSSSMYFPVKQNVSFDNPNKLIFSVYATAVLVELLQKQRDAFGLSLVSDKVDLQTETRSSLRHQTYILQQLEPLLQDFSEIDKGHKNTSIAESLHILAEKIHQRSLVVIFTDAFVQNTEHLFNALHHLKHCKHEVILFHVFDKEKELNFDYPNRPYNFIDMETGKNLKINPLEVADKYRQIMQKQQQILRDNALKYGIDYVCADINQGFDQILQPYLMKRKKMW